MLHLYIKISFNVATIIQYYPYFITTRILSRDVQEARPEHYLCKEYLERLNNKPINYRLQIQIHDKSSEDTSNIFNAGILWNKDVHPWLDLATVTVKTPLSREALQRSVIFIYCTFVWYTVCKLFLWRSYHQYVLSQFHFMMHFDILHVSY